MKILYVVPDLAMGGVTTIVEKIIQGMKDKHHDTNIISLKDNDNIINVGMRRKSDILISLYRFHKIVIELKPDVIHSHNIYPNIFVLMYKILFNRKIRIINTKHNTLGKEESSSYIFKFYKKLSYLANNITFVSQASMNSYVNNHIVSRNKSVLVYNGVSVENNNSNINDITNIKSEIIKFCFIGRLTPEKNIGLIIDAFEELSKNKSSQFFELYIIGDGLLRLELIQVLRERNIQNIYILGYRKNINSYLDKMDCILLSSLTESLPTIILEAYSKKKIVISTDVGGVNEIIKDKIFLSESNNKKEYLRCLEEFCNLSLDQRLMYEENNYQIFLKNFTSEKMIVEYECLYSEVISKP